MLILALDASQIRGVVVLCDERGTVFAQNAGSTSVVHSEGLLTLLHETLENNNYSLKDVDLFACGVGPGSFTGIRVALATVKALAQALGKPMQGVSSLKALAYSYSANSSQKFIPIVNAYQKSVFVGAEENGDWVDRSLAPEAVGSWAQGQFAGKSYIFVGNGALVYAAELRGSFPEGTVLELENSEIEAQGLAKAVSEAMTKTPRGVSHLDVHANYVRPSAAEAKLDKSDQN